MWQEHLADVLMIYTAIFLIDTSPLMEYWYVDFVLGRGRAGNETHLQNVAGLAVCNLELAHFSHHWGGRVDPWILILEEYR